MKKHFTGLQSETDIPRLQKMTDKEITAVALSDEDSPPIEHWPENVIVYYPPKKG